MKDLPVRAVKLNIHLLNLTFSVYQINIDCFQMLCSQEFSREAKLLSHLRDANICQLVGVCMKDRPPAIIMEYSKHGDLCQLLQRCSLEGRAIESGCLPIR